MAGPFDALHPRDGGGRFREKTTRAPSGALRPAPGATGSRIEELEAAYRKLWQRVNTNHRQTVYGDASRISRTTTDTAELAILSHLAFGDAAMNVARNPATPPEVLHKMAVGHSEHRNDDIRRAAVMHPNCDPETIREVWAHRGTPAFEGRAADVVATAPNTPADIRREAESWEPMIRLAA